MAVSGSEARGPPTTSAVDDGARLDVGFPSGASHFVDFNETLIATDLFGIRRWHCTAIPTAPDDSAMPGTPAKLKPASLPKCGARPIRGGRLR